MKSVKKVSKKPVTARDPMTVPVSSIMTKRVTKARPDLSLEAAMDVMVTKEIGHLPIVDEDGVLMGIVSKTDLVRDQFIDGNTSERKGTQARGKELEELGNGVSIFDADKSVSDVMSTRVHTVADTASVAEAAMAMARYRVHGLPVVTKDKVVVGFVSTFDIVGWVAAN